MGMKMIDRMLRLMDERGLSQAALERAVQLPVNRVGKWVKGTGEPTATQALKIARLLAVPLEWLVDEEGADETPAEGGSVSRDDAAVLDVVHLLGLTRTEAMRRIMQPEVYAEAGSTKPDFPRGGSSPKRAKGG